MLAAERCHAAAPVYVDLGGLIVYGALYLLGLLALSVALARSRRKAVWLLVLAAYVTAPIAYYFSVGAISQARSARILEEVRLGEASNVQAFAAYCKDRKRVVHTRVPHATDDSLLIRLERGFTGVGWQFNAFPIRDHMAKSQACR
jgi:hypothetical protein